MSLPLEEERAEADRRSSSRTELTQDTSAASDLEGDAATVWLGAWLPLPVACARLLAALASIGRAFR
jgi:hypothetical protein